MGIPSIFEVFQLAIGPSTVFTTGALRIGQAFREVLLSSPYRFNYRILIELSGNFSKFGRENNSDQAVVAGLGGFTLESSGILLQTFYKKIKENGSFPFFGDFWPFNPESDLVFIDSEQGEQNQNIIRFHLISKTGQPVYQAEYYSISNGLIKGTGIMEPAGISQENSVESLAEIKKIISSERVTPLGYVISSECHRHKISIEHLRNRMMVTWKLMIAHSSISTVDRSDQNRAASYAAYLSERILNNRPIITSPTCTGSAVVPAVLRYFQEKYLFSDDKMVDGLIIGGLFGSLILHRINLSGNLLNMHTEVAFSAAIATAGAVFLVGGTIAEIEKAASMAIMLYSNPDQDKVTFDPLSFKLINTMVAQTLPPLVDLALVQMEGIVPKFDENLDILFKK